jgi:hypothetical protein
MSERILNGYEIHVVKSDKQADTTKPIPIKDQEGFTKGRSYYWLRVVTNVREQLGVVFRQQGRAITLNVFNTGENELLFQDIQNALAVESNYKKLANGDLLITPSVAGIIGNYHEKLLPYAYNPHNRDAVTNVDKPVMANKRQADGTYKQEKAVTRRVGVFVLSYQDPDIELYRAEQRIKPEWIVETETNPDDLVTK